VRVKDDADVQVVIEGNTWVATCGGVKLQARTYPGGTTAATRTTVPDEPGSEAALAAIARALTHRVAEAGGRLLTTDRESDAAWNAALEAAGCEEHHRKLLVERDLTGDLPTSGSFGWRTLTEAGEAEFIAMLAAVAPGDPEVERATDWSAERSWRESVEYAADDLDRTLWRLPLLDGEPVGIVLPVIWPRKVIEGTQFHIAVHPAWRRRGLGRALHAAGLHLLADAGATRYVGSTWLENAAMTRVFERNGCRVKLQQIYLTCGTARASA
jgi:RimJ/RimL family protein N-acetyltransferase